MNISFKEYVGVERRLGTYVEAHYALDTIERLAAWVKEFKIPEPLDPKKYHSTMLYSRVYLPQLHRVLYDSRADLVQWLATPTSFKLFPSRGPKGDAEKAALVMVLDAPELDAQHIKYRLAGGTHDHDEYITHLTLSYGCPLDYDVSKLKLPDFKLKVYQVSGKELDFNWKEKK